MKRSGPLRRTGWGKRGAPLERKPMKRTSPKAIPGWSLAAKGDESCRVCGRPATDLHQVVAQADPVSEVLHARNPDLAFKVVEGPVQADGSRGLPLPREPEALAQPLGDDAPGRSLRPQPERFPHGIGVVTRLEDSLRVLPIPEGGAPRDVDAPTDRVGLRPLEPLGLLLSLPLGDGEEDVAGGPAADRGGVELLRGRAHLAAGVLDAPQHLHRPRKGAREAVQLRHHDPVQFTTFDLLDGPQQDRPRVVAARGVKLRGEHDELVPGAGCPRADLALLELRGDQGFLALTDAGDTHVSGPGAHTRRNSKGPNESAFPENPAKARAEAPKSEVA